MKKTNIILLFILIGSSFMPINLSNNIHGNWMIRKSLDSINIYQEIYIDSVTVNIFASDVMDVTFSSYYKNDCSKIYFLDKNKIDTISNIDFLIDENSLVLRNDSIIIEYRKVNNGTKLGDYLMDIGKEKEFFKAFKIREKQFRNRKK